MTAAHSPGWQNPRILLTLLVVFLCGASAGMLAMALGAHHWMHPAARAAWQEGGKEVSLQRFQKELELTPAQTEQLETILDDFFTYYHTLQAQLDDVRASGRQRILRVLNDDQKKKFEKIMNEFQVKPLR
jgi:Spy/CpxP family protein refolding chaperone